jgi:hypothetical protein
MRLIHTHGEIGRGTVDGLKIVMSVAGVAIEIIG